MPSYDDVIFGLLMMPFAAAALGMLSLGKWLNDRGRMNGQVSYEMLGTGSVAIGAIGLAMLVGVVIWHYYGPLATGIYCWFAAC